MNIITGLPHLDIYSLSETWAIGEALHGLWQKIGYSLGAMPSNWFDDDGKRIYAAVMAFEIERSLSEPVGEDVAVEIETRLAAIRKPHAIGVTRFMSQGKCLLQVKLLTSLVRRDIPGSNKKLSKVKTLWQAPDTDLESVDQWLTNHHSMKRKLLDGPVALQHEANRLGDFNAADLFYFRNFAHLAGAAEWRFGRNQPPLIAASRAGFYYGNLDDGEAMSIRVSQDGRARRVEMTNEAGALLFVSVSRNELVQLPLR